MPPPRTARPIVPTTPLAGSAVLRSKVPLLVFLPNVLSLLRPHIVLIAALAAAVFGQLFDGRANWTAALWVGLDWLLLNFWNRVADVDEDRLNGVAGTEFAARHARASFLFAAGVLALSVWLTLPLGGGFLALRLGFQALGFAYNFPLLPRRTRLKEIVVLKNVSAAVLFVLSCIGYPLALRQGGRVVPWGELFGLAVFFLCLEMTYELFYDLRDVEGDRLAHLMTVPVKFGTRLARRAIAALLAVSGCSLVVGFVLGALSFTEVLLIAAPLQQALVLAFWLRKRVTSAEAVGLTYLGAAQLASFLVWTGFGLPLSPWTGLR